MSQRLLSVGAMCIAVSALTCEDRPGDRTFADMDVGRVTSEGVTFAVVDGLAAVHHASEGALTLWASAPTFSVRVSSDATEAQSWTVTLVNAMPDGLFTADAPAAASLLDPEADDPGTTRRFSVTLPPGESVLSFETPDLDDSSPFRFVLLSDVQEGIDRVADVFAAINSQPARFVLGAGDLAETGSREELERFQREMRGLALPYYTTLGNHDVHSDAAWHELFGRGNFRFLFRGVQFTMIDSAAATIDTLAYTWLDEWLQQGRDRMHIVAMHVPPLDPIGTRNGAFGDRNEAGKLLASLARGGVDLTLYGHIHSFYQYENASIPAFISGGGGADDEKLDSYGRHFMLIEVGADAGVVSTNVVFVD
jgi:Icc protein